jgi:hypothetical protein
MPEARSNATKCPVQTALDELALGFRAQPNAYFHERELHAEFYSLARPRAGRCKTKDGDCIDLLRYEYDSLNRYVGRAYKQPVESGGRTAAFDFAVLQQSFVHENDLLTVINKHETRRQVIRRKWITSEASPAIDIAIEFKMAHHRSKRIISPGQINQLKRGMLQDCRKLKCERPARAMVIGFSHGPEPYEMDAQSIIDECKQTWEGVRTGTLVVSIVTPDLILPRCD